MKASFRSTKATKTLESLIESGDIPAIGNFAVSDELVDLYVRTYPKVNGQTAAKIDMSHARRMAGMQLVHEKLLRGIKPSQMSEGFVYVIGNPAWPEHCKIGIAVDVESRLGTYQTSSPFRDYVLEKYEFVLDRKESERILHIVMTKSYSSGEWVLRKDLDKIYDAVTRKHRILTQNKAFEQKSSPRVKQQRKLWHERKREFLEIEKMISTKIAEC